MNQGSIREPSLVATLLVTPRNALLTGLRSSQLRAGDSIVGMSVIGEGAGGGHILAVTKRGYGKRVKEGEFRSQGRGGVGVIAIKFKRGEGDEEDELRCLR